MADPFPRSMLTPLAQDLVDRFRADGRFVLSRSRQIGVIAILLVVVISALFIDLARSSDSRPGYLGLLILTPVLVIGLVFGVKQVLPGGDVVVDRLGIHLPHRSVAWAQIEQSSVESTSGWRSYHYVRLTLRDKSTVDLPLLLTPSAYDQGLAIRHLLDDSGVRPADQ